MMPLGPWTKADLVMLSSRQDASFGPADVFNEEIWNETVAYFTGPTIDLAMASKARTARVIASASTNPQFTLPQLGAHFMYGETAAYQFVFGDWDLDAQDPKDMIHTPRERIQYFFRACSSGIRIFQNLAWLTILMSRERTPAVRAGLGEAKESIVYGCASKPGLCYG